VLFKLRLFHRNARGLKFASAVAVTSEDLKRRTKKFAADIVNFARALPRDVASAHMARQIVKSGTAVGANYRASCRAKSNADFISKMTTVEEEADETMFWMQLLVATDTVPAKSAAALLDEAEQLLRIVVASINTARGGSR
jgi:four helix bundle protein